MTVWFANVFGLRNQFTGLRILSHKEMRTPHAVHRGEGEVQDIPLLRNDMKDEAPTMDRQLDAADAPGKADSEMIEEGI